MIKEAITLPGPASSQREVRPRLSIDSDLPESAGVTMRSGIEFEVIDPTGGAEWDSLVSAHPEASFFHSSAWARVLVNTYGHRPFYLHLSEEGKSVALLPLMEVASRLTGRRAVSLPFSDSCQPLLFPGVKAESMLRPLQALARKNMWRYLEFRGDCGLATADHAPTFYGHTLDLQVGLETLNSGMESSVRRAIRKGKASDLSVKVERSPEALAQFVALHARTRKRHGAPPQPRLFFRQIFDHIIRPGLGFVVLARRGATAVAAATFFVRGSKAIFKFGASDETQQSLRGNNLVMWEAIRFLSERGVGQLDFGRTAVEHEGLRRFKLGWGTIEKPITYRRFDPKTQVCTSVTARSPGISAHIFSRMPAIVNQMAGRLLYPHLD